MVGTVTSMTTLRLQPFLIFGHRGASAHATENSLAAFRLAAEQGADGVELDVRRTADDALVVHHDPTIAGVGPIIDRTLEELRRAAPGLVTFPEAMAACDGLIVNIEIKNSPVDPDFDPDDTVADTVTRWVVENGWRDRVIISSFNPVTVDRVRALDDGCATGQLIDPGADAAGQLEIAHQRGHRALHPHFSSLTDAPQLVTTAQELGMWLLVWTVDAHRDIRALQEAGLTGVITNDPAGARAAIA